MIAPWEPAHEQGYAVELWCLPAAIDHTTLVSMPIPEGSRTQPFLLELTSRNRITLHQPASVRFLHRWPTGLDGGDNLYSDQYYVPGRWNHVVAQMVGERMELYLNGKATTPMPVDPDYRNLPCRLLLGQLSTIPIYEHKYSRPFVGWMDEVALYDQPLAAEEISAHHRLGLPAAPGARTAESESSVKGDRSRPLHRVFPNGIGEIP